jgi:putative transcriptional regulator
MADGGDRAMDQAALRERLAAAYAAGQLNPAMCLLVETQAQLLPQAAEDLALAETLAGAFLEQESPTNLSRSALEDVFARIAQGDPAPAKERTAARRAAGVLDEILHLPKAVQDAALESIGRGGWTFAGPGIRILPLDLGGDAKAEIIRIEPGWGAPRHSHEGEEFTLVLTGAFSDERGRYGVGDIAMANPHVTHKPIALPGEVCYSLAVTDAPLAFTGALGLIQKIWKH